MAWTLEKRIRYWKKQPTFSFMKVKVTFDVINGWWFSKFPGGEKSYHKMQKEEGDFSAPVLLWNSLGHFFAGTALGLVLPWYATTAIIVAKETKENWGRHNYLKQLIDVTTWTAGSYITNVIINLYF